MWAENEEGKGGRGRKSERETRRNKGEDYCRMRGRRGGMRSIRKVIRCGRRVKESVKRKEKQGRRLQNERKEGRWVGGRERVYGREGRIG